MGVTQAAISHMEQPRDLLLSSLSAYLQAIGGAAPRVHEPGVDLCHTPQPQQLPSAREYAL
jgi:hypothetical protein